MQTALLNDPSKAAYAEAFRNTMQGNWNPENTTYHINYPKEGLHVTEASHVGPGWSPVTNAAGKVPEPSTMEPDGSLDKVASAVHPATATLSPGLDSVKLSLADARKRAAADTPGPGGD